MTKEDMIAINFFYPKWYQELKPKKIVLLSPLEELESLKKILFFSDIDVVSKDDWDLNKKIDKKWDLCIVHNVFHYSPDPKLWFLNIFNSCNTIWIIDHIDRDRGITQFGNDGDCMRYEYSPYIFSNSKVAFDLCEIKKITNFFTYINPINGATNNQFVQNISFIAEIKHVN